MEKTQFAISTLLPSVQYSFLTSLRCTSSVTAAAEDQQVRVLISKQESCVPILSAVVKLPLFEQEEEEEPQFRQSPRFGNMDDASHKADMLVM